MARKAMLLIMDGWGLGDSSKSDAIFNAKTPFVDSLYNQYPNAQLAACGNAVGLPEGQMGNSEVGHLNLGAGRVVFQELQRINNAFASRDLLNHKLLNDAIQYSKETGKNIHLIGLVSDGGVHSHIDHLKGLVDIMESNHLSQYYIHAFTDGRDTDPNSAKGFLLDLEKHLAGTSGQLASIIGRFYAMDRDKRWERVALAYNALVKGEGKKTQSWQEQIEQSYQGGVTDEFIEPIIIQGNDGSALTTIKDGDVVLCFNFRTDRCREITEVLTQQPFQEFNMQPLDLKYLTMTEYDASFKDVQVLFKTDNLEMTLGEVLSNTGKKQIRIAETEKYPHVTFFFSGGREEEFEGERRIICASPKDVTTYDQKPEMSAYDITEAILPEIQSESADFICLNFANTDMVGHTGVWDAAIKAAEVVDECVSKIVPEALAKGYAIFLTADHGNSDYLINEDGSPNTAHSLNPVPLFLISNDYQGSLKDGKLGDIAPTILNYLKIEIPAKMTGDVLI